MGQVVRGWCLVGADGSVVGVRLLVVAGSGARLEVAAGAGWMTVGWARFVSGGWSVRLPVSGQVVRARSWPAARGWMLDEALSLVPGRLVRSPGPVCRGPGGRPGSGR
jgi:hypothetical protein